MKFITVLIFTAIMFNTGYAQFGSLGSIDARSLGLAGTSNSISTGVYSIGINPANLAINKNNYIDFTTVLPFPSVSINTGTNFLSLSDINYFFGGVDGEARVLTDADKQRFSSLMQDGGLVFINATLSLFSFGININDDIGVFAFSIQDAAGANLYLPNAVTEIALNGNPQGKAFNLDDAHVKAWWVRSYSLSYARNVIEPIVSTFDRFTVGVTAKLIHGYSYIGTDHINYNFTTGPSNQITGKTDLLGYSSFSDAFGVKYDFDSVSQKSSLGVFPSPAGTGFGIDLGLAAIKDNWGFSLSLTDLGKVYWSNKAAEFYSFGEVYIDDLINKDQMDSLTNSLLGDSRKIEEFSTGLPATLRLGTSYIFDKGVVPGSLLLAFDYDQGFNSLPGNSKYPRFSVGAEWKPLDWVPYLRSGFSYNAEFGFNWGLGLGIDIKIIELHFASSTMQSFFAPDQTKNLSFSFGSRWKIN